MSALRLRHPDTRRDVLALEPGVHALTLSTLGAQGDEDLAKVYVDSRGVWMQLRDGLRGAYVNGRPIRQMAMLRAGDSLFLHGQELLLVGREPEPAPVEKPSPQRGPVRCVLRAIGGPLHGRCFSLARGVSIGNAADCDVRIDDARVAARHVELVPMAIGVAMATGSNASAVMVNGHRMGDALLKAGDQVVLAGTHRFVIEAPHPIDEAQAAETAPAQASAAVKPAPRRRAWRFPWLLLAALLMAAVLSALLLYGVR